jgi:hypothetical protein
MEKQYDDTVIDSATSLFSDASLAKSQIQASYGRMMEASPFSSETKEAFQDLFKKCDMNFFRRVKIFICAVSRQRQTLQSIME